MPEHDRLHWTRWLVVSALVFAADLATKGWVVSAFRPGESLEVTPFFSLILTYNPGAAFSFLADAGGWQRWLFTGLTLVISIAIVVALRRHPDDRLMALSLALVLGGALGNLCDRVRIGRVVDFVLLHVGEHSFPAFNVADSAISVGVVLLLLDSLASGARARSAARPKET
jgi:signal peptidase II